MLVIGTEFVEQIKNLVDYPVRTCAFAVNFIDDHNWIKTTGKGFLRDKARLRHRAIDGINQQENAIHHRQHTFNFTAEVGMPGGINDIDVIVFPVDGGVFGENGNTTLALLIIGIHYPFDLFAAGLQRTGLLQEFINQCGLAMIDVRDNGDIANIFYHFRAASRR